MVSFIIRSISMEPKDSVINEFEVYSIKKSHCLPLRIITAIFVVVRVSKMLQYI